MSPSRAIPAEAFPFGRAYRDNTDFSGSAETFILQIQTLVVHTDKFPGELSDPLTVTLDFDDAVPSGKSLSVSILSGQAGYDAGYRIVGSSVFAAGSTPQVAIERKGDFKHFSEDTFTFESEAFEIKSFLTDIGGGRRQVKTFNAHLVFLPGERTLRIEEDTDPPVAGKFRYRDNYERQFNSAPTFPLSGVDEGSVRLVDLGDNHIGISLAHVPDYGSPKDADKDNVYTVHMSHWQGEYPSASQSSPVQTIFVEVEDVLGQPSGFSGKAFEVSENTDTVFVLGKSDGSGSYEYILGADGEGTPNDNGYFELTTNAASGEVRLKFKSVPHYERPRGAELADPTEENLSAANVYTVHVADRAGTVGSGVATVLVTVLNEEEENAVVYSELLGDGVFIEDSDQDISLNVHGGTPGRRVSLTVESDFAALGFSGGGTVTSFMSSEHSASAPFVLTLRYSGKLSAADQDKVGFTLWHDDGDGNSNTDGVGVVKIPPVSSGNDISLNKTVKGNRDLVLSVSDYKEQVGADPDRTKALRGADRELFVLDEDGNLRFREAPDFDSIPAGRLFTVWVRGEQVDSRKYDGAVVTVTVAAPDALEFEGGASVTVTVTVSADGVAPTGRFHQLSVKSSDGPSYRLIDGGGFFKVDMKSGNVMFDKGVRMVKRGSGTEERHTLTLEASADGKTARQEMVVLIKDGVVKLPTRIRGSSSPETLNGLSGVSDHFDGDAGGNDVLRGRSGSDVYWLGRGTDHDEIDEAYSNSNYSGDTDEVRLKDGIKPSEVRLLRVGRYGADLYIGLVDGKGNVTDSMKVRGYYFNLAARIEKVVFSDGTEWGAKEFAVVRIRGGSGPETLDGHATTADHFDGDAGGNDVLRGRGKSDIYWFGRGTGFDEIDEAYSNRDYSDDTDEIRFKEGIKPSEVRLLRVGRYGADLYIGLMDGEGNVTDSMKVRGYYLNPAARIEKVVFSDGTEWGAKEFAVVRIRGDSGPETLDGHATTADHFDGDAGGNDVLRGRGKSDIYWFGRGTDHDEIDEADSNRDYSDDTDEIRFKEGINPSEVRLLRVGRYGADLYIGLVDGKGNVTDSMKVRGYYFNPAARIEKVVFSDGTEWGAKEFAVVRIRGGSSPETLDGHHTTADHFDGDAGGNDVLRGRSKSDIYWFGRGTDHDEIDEAYSNSNYSSDTDEIRFKDGIKPSEVRLLRVGQYGGDLYIGLLDGKGNVTDSMKVRGYYFNPAARIEKVLFADGTEWGAKEFAVVRIRGGSSPETLDGHHTTADHFDGDAGGNDVLRGRSKSDIYWFGRGTGFDEIDEAYSNSNYSSDTDEIRLKDGIKPSELRLSRVGRYGGDLYIRLMDGKGNVTDSMKVRGYYFNPAARIEKVVFSDGTEWGAKEFALARIRGGSSPETLDGHHTTADHFDGDAGGNDVLRGRSKSDVYWLGRGTGFDEIDEAYSNSNYSSDTDEIRLKAGIKASEVKLWRGGSRGNDLYIGLLDGNGKVTDSLKVRGHYSNPAARIERLVFSDGTVRTL